MSDDQPTIMHVTANEHLEHQVRAMADSELRRVYAAGFRPVAMWRRGTERATPLRDALAVVNAEEATGARGRVENPEFDVGHLRDPLEVLATVRNKLQPIFEAADAYVPAGPDGEELRRDARAAMTQVREALDDLAKALGGQPPGRMTP